VGWSSDCEARVSAHGEKKQRGRESSQERERKGVSRSLSSRPGLRRWRESQRRRAMRHLHAGASGTKVGDDSLESGWAKVGFARDER
jgi:hypothetical protein